MNEVFDLQAYLSASIENFMKDVLKATLKNPRESAFMLKFAAATASASGKRKAAEEAGEHIPSFLIASITSQCNLHCAGCYSRCNHATVDAEPVSQLTSDEWLKIFSEADELGISFILLAGGEPMLRRDIIEAAGKRQNILFPIFTKSIHTAEQSHARSHLIPTSMLGILPSVRRCTHRSLPPCGTDGSCLTITAAAVSFMKSVSWWKACSQRHKIIGTGYNLCRLSFKEFSGSGRCRERCICRCSVPQAPSGRGHEASVWKYPFRSRGQTLRRL